MLANLSPAERRRGVVAVSTGNHCQLVAFAARRFGVRAIVFVPEDANLVKLRAMELLGAELRAVGESFDEARHAAEAFAEETGMPYIHSGNEPLLIAWGGHLRA